MLDIQSIRTESSALTQALARKGFVADFAALLEWDTQRSQLIQETERMRHELKSTSKEIGMRKSKAQTVTDDEMNAMKELREAISMGEQALAKIELSIRDFLLSVPNTPLDDVPQGKDESENVEVRKWGTIPKFSFKALSHDDLGQKLGILSGEDGAELAKARFSVLRGPAARLERALLNFMLDTHTAKGYEEILPPFMANSKALTGTGQLPKFAADLFKVEAEDLYLIPTAEVPLTNLYAGKLIKSIERGKPMKLTAYTPCFRSEAGSYGKDTKGYIRQHQFNKVEIVKLCHPDDSSLELETLTNDAEAILQALNLPYRVVCLCSGDLGFSSAKTYDLEVWLPSQNCYREISSCSTFSDYQARRAGLRFKDPETGKNATLHTLNGSGLAIGRTLVAIFENYQQADGSILIPAVLQAYMGGLEKIG